MLPNEGHRRHQLRANAGHREGGSASRRAEWLSCGLCILALSCGGSGPSPATANAVSASDVLRYRLPLRDNPVDPGQAFRCYGACQEQPTPDVYIECLARCPGFERTRGVACTPSDVPPVAACFTARPLQAGSEPSRESVVVVIYGVPVSIGLSAVCASQTEPCSYSGAGLVP